MPRKIGYGKFTPKRKAALRKAQLASARARRKHGSDERTRRKRRNRRLGAAAVGAAAAIGVAAAVHSHQQGEKREVAKIQDRLNAERDNSEALRMGAESKARKTGLLAHRAETARLKTQAGNVHGPALNQQQYDARVILYGDVIGEFSDVHEGRAEIFPTLPRAEVVKVFQKEAIKPSYSIWDENPEEEFVTLFHRTGGGNDLDAKTAKASILKNQGMQILNRDEKRADPSGVSHNNNFSWWSNKLNDSNTREAFGEDVVQMKISKKLLQANQALAQPQSFGELSPIKETWMAIDPSLIQGATIEDAQHLVTPKKERRFRAPT